MINFSSKSKQTAAKKQVLDSPLMPSTVIHVDKSNDWDTPQIISPTLSFAFAILAGGAITILIWSVTYRMPIASTSKGLLYSSPRLYGVTSKTDGQVLDIRVENGQTVKKGQPLATLDFKDDAVRFESAKRQSELASDSQLIASNLIPPELRQQIYASRKSLAEVNKNLGAQSIILSKKISNLNEYRALAKKGYLSKVELLQYEEQAISMQADVGKLKSEQNKLLAERGSIERQLKTALNSAQKSLSQAKETERLSALRLQSATSIKAPIDGVVVQITKREGQAVQKGLELFVLSPDSSKGLKAAVLASGEEAGKIRKGDRALISPSSASPQRFGYVEGVVIDVSPYPTNPSAFSRLVGSEVLAKEVFSTQESKLPLLVLVEPKYINKDLVWVGSKGPPWPVRSGILADVKIITQERLPISYVIPWLKKVTGFDQI